MKIEEHFAKIMGTFFYVGYLPLIPGTFGSLAGIIVYSFIRTNFFVYSSVTLALIMLGFLVSGKIEKIMLKKDASCIVIDEVCGMLLSLMFVPCDIKVIFAAFILFRIFDTLKPFPSGRMQSLKGGLGVMSDDIIAAVYTNIVLQIALRLASFKTS